MVRFKHIMCRLPSCVVEYRDIAIDVKLPRYPPRTSAFGVIRATALASSPYPSTVYQEVVREIAGTRCMAMFKCTNPGSPPCTRPTVYRALNRDGVS